MRWGNSQTEANRLKAHIAKVIADRLFVDTSWLDDEEGIEVRSVSERRFLRLWTFLLGPTKRYQEALVKEAARTATAKEKARWTKAIYGWRDENVPGAIPLGLSEPADLVASLQRIVKAAPTSPGCSTST